jgi:TadE-like protein
MSSKQHRQRGSVLVEMALVLPVLLLLVLGGMDLSLMTNSKSNLDYVARTTSQCMVHNPSCPPQTFAAQLATGVNLRGTLTVTASGPPCPLPAAPPVPCSVTVTAVDGWTPISPFFHTYTLTSVATSVQ